MQSHIVMLTLVALFFMLGLIHICALKLSREHPDEMRLIWYLFSLVLLLTNGLTWWAIHAQALDSEGNFVGPAGAILNEALEWLLDPYAEFKALGIIVGVVVVPQLLGYLISGAYGCASTPLFVGSTFQFVFWSAVKSYITWAIILCSIANWGFYEGWRSMPSRKDLGLTFISVTFLLTAFGAMYFYYESPGICSWFRRTFPKTVERCTAVHRRFTRHTQKKRRSRLALAWGILTWLLDSP